MRVDSGLDEEASTNYSKIAKAIGNIMNRGIHLSLIDINKSQYMFEPDEANDTIIYGMKGLNGISGDIIQTIIENRPYTSMQDFMDRVKVNKTQMVSLIKAGAFDQFNPREENMREYIWSVCEPKKRLTLQNFNGLMERNLVPAELEFEKRVFVFNRALKKHCKIDDYYVLKADNYYNFYSEFFDVDLLEPYGNSLGIKQSKWDTIYKSKMNPVREYFKKHKDELLQQLNDSLFQEMWNKYAEGCLSKWEMDSLGMYYHPHELINVQNNLYGIKSFKDLPEQPEVEYTFKRNGREIPIFKTNRIAGTVIAKDDTRSSISILTIDSGVVTVKMNRDYFAKYNRRISEVLPNGKKHYIENGWFTKGTLVVVSGIRRGDIFMTKKYKKSLSHQLYKIIEIEDNGVIKMTNARVGEDEDE